MTYTQPTSRRPLLENELTAELQNVFDLSSQMVQAVPGRKTDVMTVKRSCPSCGECDWLRVAMVRQQLKRGVLTGNCRRCNSRLERLHLSGEAHHKWKGGIRTDPSGYVWLRRPTHPYAKNGYIQEHRLVVEDSLGRVLFPTETVHHKNGIKSDNRLENLALWARNHGDGCRYEDLSIEQLEDMVTFLQQLIEQKSEC